MKHTKRAKVERVMKKGRVIIFDLFGTILTDLSNEYKKGLDWLCQDVLKKGTNFDTAMNVAEHFRRTYMQNRATTYRETSMLKQLEMFKAKIGFRTKLSLNDIEYNFFNTIRTIAIADGLLDLLKYLKYESFSIFVMSNTIYSAVTIKRLLNVHGLLQYFDGVYTSGDCGHRKPGYKFFNYTFKEIKLVEKVKREDIIFVGNSLEKDMLGARRFGFNPIWLSSELSNIGEQLADCARVRSLIDCKEYLEKNYLCVAGISKNYSVSDGVGNRIVVYLQGCDIRCNNCHNQKTWNKLDGKFMTVRRLVSDALLKMSSRARSVTISGGEPLTQSKALLTLLSAFELAGVDVCLYTGHEFDKVSEQIKNLVHYLKTGPFVHMLETTTKGYYGSTNQKFWEKGENGEWKQKR
jgi:FMN phosphatase YigB (HAD superfamily)